jgi:Asp-tRNA(Asn)/Glu-tRNA(Gln) amidotransferase C subunit
MILFAPTPTQSQIQIPLRAFLLSVLPGGVGVYQGQDNRVPEPIESDFVVMTAMRRERIETNVDTYADASFIASIAGAAMIVTQMQLGTIAAGALVFGTGVAAGTAVVSGPGGVGDYVVTGSQTVASEQMATGLENILQPTKVTFQLDVHGPNSADNAEVISTLFRDDYATLWFRRNGYTTVSPLHADDPQQVPFVNDQQQVETRWIVECLMQANQIAVVPQQFADQLKVAITPLL